MENNIKIILPEYINFQEFKNNFNKKINGSFDYAENNRLEYDLNCYLKIFQFKIFVVKLKLLIILKTIKFINWWLY